MEYADRPENVSGQTINVEAVTAYYEAKDDFRGWFEQTIAGELDLDDDEKLTYLFLAEELYRSVEGSHYIFPGEEEKVAEAVTRGMFFGLYSCARHYYFETEPELRDGVVQVAAAKTLELVDEVRGEHFDNPDEAYSALSSRFFGEQPEGLERVVTDFKYELCDDITMQRYFEFGSTAGGYIFTFAKHLDDGLREKRDDIERSREIIQEFTKRLDSVENVLDLFGGEESED